jgi:hypothetical protein
MTPLVLVLTGWFYLKIHIFLKQSKNKSAYETWPQILPKRLIVMESLKPWRQKQVMLIIFEKRPKTLMNWHNAVETIQ